MTESYIEEIYRANRFWPEPNIAYTHPVVGEFFHYANEQLELIQEFFGASETQLNQYIPNESDEKPRLFIWGSTYQVGDFKLSEDYSTQGMMFNTNTILNARQAALAKAGDLIVCTSAEAVAMAEFHGVDYIDFSDAADGLQMYRTADHLMAHMLNSPGDQRFQRIIKFIQQENTPVVYPYSTSPNELALIAILKQRSGKDLQYHGNKPEAQERYNTKGTFALDVRNLSAENIDKLVPGESEMLQHPLAQALRKHVGVDAAKLYTQQALPAYLFEASSSAARDTIVEAIIEHLQNQGYENLCVKIARGADGVGIIAELDANKPETILNAITEINGDEEFILTVSVDIIEVNDQELSASVRSLINGTVTEYLQGEFKDGKEWRGNFMITKAKQLHEMVIAAGHNNVTLDEVKVEFKRILKLAGNIKEALKAEGITVWGIDNLIGFVNGKFKIILTDPNFRIPGSTMLDLGDDHPDTTYNVTHVINTPPFITDPAELYKRLKAIPPLELTLCNVIAQTPNWTMILLTGDNNPELIERIKLVNTILDMQNNPINTSPHPSPTASGGREEV